MLTGMGGIIGVLLFLSSAMWAQRSELPWRQLEAATA